MNIYHNKITSYLVWRLILRNPRVKAFVTSLLYPHDNKCINMFGSRIHINPQKEVGYYRAFKQQDANIVFRDEIPSMLSFFSLMQSGTTFVDAGANVGLWSATFGTLSNLFKNVRGFAFEPNPDTFLRLQVTVAPFGHIKCIQTALSNMPGVLEFFSGPASGIFSVKGGPFNNASSKPIASVEALTLDSFLRDEKDVMIKIDVEGHELEVLQGAIVSFGRGIVRVVFIDGFEASTGEPILALLKQSGFSIFDAHTRAPLSSLVGQHGILAVRNAVSKPAHLE